MATKRETFRITAKDEVTKKVTSVKIPTYVVEFYAQKIYVQVHGRKFDQALKMAKQRAKQILEDILELGTWSDTADLLCSTMLKECL